MITSKKRLGREGWQQHIDQWRDSGLTQTEYCAQHDINSRYFSTWKGKLMPKSPVNHAPKFIAVDVAPDDKPSIDSGVTKVELSNGVSIHIPSGLPKAETQKLLGVLMDLAC